MTNYMSSFVAMPCDAANIRSLVSRNKLLQDSADKALLMLKGVLDYSEFKNMDMVIEVCISFNINLATYSFCCWNMFPFKPSYVVVIIFVYNCFSSSYIRKYYHLLDTIRGLRKSYIRGMIC